MSCTQGGLQRITFTLTLLPLCSRDSNPPTPTVTIGEGCCRRGREKEWERGTSGRGHTHSVGFTAAHSPRPEVDPMNGHRDKQFFGPSAKCQYRSKAGHNGNESALPPLLPNKSSLYFDQSASSSPQWKSEIENQALVVGYLFIVAVVLFIGHRRALSQAGNY